MRKWCGFKFFNSYISNNIFAADDRNPNSKMLDPNKEFISQHNLEHLRISYLQVWPNPRLDPCDQILDPFDILALYSSCMFVSLSAILFPCKVSTKGNHIQKCWFICFHPATSFSPPNYFSRSKRELVLVQCSHLHINKIISMARV